MTTFDDILPRVSEVFRRQGQQLEQLGKIIINRDLNGRVRLIISESARQCCELLNTLANDLAEQLEPHTYSAADIILFEENLDTACAGVTYFLLEEFPNVKVIDRLAVESHWTQIAPVSKGVPRIVFYSIKGGVGRSTALAATAWSLAQQGRRVLVLDLDLESPGISSALLPPDRRPLYGITDWLVEDLVDNGETVIEDLVATSALSHDGEICVVPAHGKMPGEYVSKLGRVWMPKTGENGKPEIWSQRLARLIDSLEQEWNPDVILLDSRAGIDEVASSCITDLGAELILLFAIDGEQTWSGYRVLFDYWNRTDKVKVIRDRLQLVGAMLPDDETSRDYFDRLREAAANLFGEYLYDEIPPGESEADYFSFDEGDLSAPHYPWEVQWNKGFATLHSLHARLAEIDATKIKAIFGHLIDGIETVVSGSGVDK